MTKQEKDGILSSVLDVPTVLKSIKLAPKNKLERLLMFFNLMKPTYKVLVLEGLKLSTNYRLTAISNSLWLHSNLEGEQEKVMEIMHENIYQMAGYVATAIHNHNSETPRYLIDTLVNELTSEELKIAVDEVYRRLDVQSFFGSMELIRNLSLM